MKLLLIVSIICAGLIAAGSVQSAEIKINQQYTAVSHRTMVDTNDDGVFADAVSFQMRGSPGRAIMEGVVEPTPLVPGESPCDLQNEPVQQSYVQTYNDGSMLFLVTTAGYGCLDLSTYEIWAEVSGVITGGVGRFESATGTWTAEIHGVFVGQTQIVYTGPFKGTIEIPD